MVYDDKLELVFLIGGVTLTISKTGDYRWLEGGVSGLDGPETRLITTSYAELPGSYISGAHIEARTITIKFTYDNEQYNPTIRWTLYSYFLPGAVGTLKVKRRKLSAGVYSDEERWIDFQISGVVRHEQGNIFDDNIIVTVNLFCSNPYFYAPSSTSATISGSTSATIVNSGDAACGWYIYISFSSVTNPTIRLYDATGVTLVSTITLTGTYTSSTPVTVDTRGNRAIIKKSGVEVYTYSPSSMFFKLPVGTSVVKANSPSGCTIQWLTCIPLYVGA